MNCVSCGREIEDGESVCPLCGAQQEGTKVCISCGSVIGEKELYCRICGTNQEVKPETNVSFSDALKCPACGSDFQAGEKFCRNCGTALPSVAAPAVTKQKKKGTKALPKKTLAIAGGCVALVVLVVVLIAVFSGGSGGGKFALYGGDAMTYINDSENEKVVFLTTAGKTVELDYNSFEDCSISMDGKTAMAVTDGEYDDDSGDYAYTLHAVTRSGAKEVTNEAVSGAMSADGSTIYYFGLSDNEGFGPLYRYTVSSGKTKTVTDSAYAYGSVAISPDGSAIAYIGDYTSYDDYRLYLSVDGKEGKSVSKNCMPVAASNGGKYLYYIKDGSLYVMKGEDAKKLGDDIDTYGIYLNRDGTQIVYNSGNKAYISRGGGEKQKLSSSYASGILTPTNAQKHYNYDTAMVMTLAVGDFTGTVWDLNGALYAVTKKYETEKIISSYNDCLMSEDGKSILIERSDKLYRVKDINKLSSFDDSKPMYDEDDVYSFDASSDFKAIYFINEDDELVYLKSNGKTTKVADDCDSFTVTDKGNVYFVADGGLYLSKSGGKKTAVGKLEDVSYIYSVFKGVIAYDSGDDAGYYYIADGSTAAALVSEG